MACAAWSKQTLQARKHGVSEHGPMARSSSMTKPAKLEAFRTACMPVSFFLSFFGVGSQGPIQLGTHEHSLPICQQTPSLVRRDKSPEFNPARPCCRWTYSTSHQRRRFRHKPTSNWKPPSTLCGFPGPPKSTSTLWLGFFSPPLAAVRPLAGSAKEVRPPARRPLLGPQAGMEPTDKAPATRTGLGRGGEEGGGGPSYQKKTGQGLFFGSFLVSFHLLKNRRFARETSIRVSPAG